MPSKNCKLCGIPFSYKPYRENTALFCSCKCSGKWTSTLPHVVARNKAPKPYMIGNKLRAGIRPSKGYTIGHLPWNKDLKGIHLSPDSEFKPGPRPDKRAIIGTTSIRIDRNGNERAHVKIEHPNKWKLRAIKVWEDTNGPVPKGRLIHHKDQDSLNDLLSNLQCVTRAEHRRIHADDIYAGRWPSARNLAT